MAEPIFVKSGMYREDSYSLDEFTALRFPVTGATLAASRMQILQMNQHT
jgi:hypothetical protein